MRVQLLVCMASPEKTWEAGEFWEVEAAEGARMVEAGVAILAPSQALPPVAEVSEAKAPEQPEAKAAKKREKR